MQSAKNQAVLSVATAYFDVQQAARQSRGRTRDSGTPAEAHEILSTANRRAGQRTDARLIEVERAQATLAELEQQAAIARPGVAASTAPTLTARVLRLNPGAIVLPLEPPHLQVSLMSPVGSVESLIPIALTNRPEGSNPSRPLGASHAGPAAAGTHAAPHPQPGLTVKRDTRPTLGRRAAYGTSINSLNNWNGRSSWDAEVVWEFRNLGFGNRGLIEQRRGEQRQALIELFRTQDQVAADVVQAHSLVEAATVRVAKAEMGLKAATLSYEGNLRGLSETIRAGELLQLVNRPQEVVAALQQLQQAYVNYYTSANDYNRAQFQLFWALGYSPQSLACNPIIRRANAGRLQPPSADGRRRRRRSHLWIWLQRLWTELHFSRRRRQSASVSPSFVRNQAFA